VESYPENIRGVDLTLTICLEGRCIIQTPIRFIDDFRDEIFLSPFGRSFDFIPADGLRKDSKLTFQVRLDVFNVHYFPKPGMERVERGVRRQLRSKYCRRIRTPGVTKRDFVVDEPILRHLRQSYPFSQFAEASRNDNWTLSLCSDGEDAYCILHLLKCAVYVDSMDIRILYRIQYDQEEDEELMVLDVQDVGILGARQITLPLVDWRIRKHSVNALKFKFEIRLLSAWNEKGRLLFKDEMADIRLRREIEDC